MKKNKFLLKMLITCTLGIITSSFLVENVSAQNYKLSVGSTLTKFSFMNSDGIPIDFMKNGSGTQFQIGSEYRLLDTSNFVAQSSSRRAIYFGQHKTLSRILSALIFDFSLESNQLNAVGDTRNIAFSYQTNFLGASLGLGVHIPLVFGTSINLQGRLSGQKIVQGNQLADNKYCDLTIDPQFSNVQIFYGFAGELQKKLSDKLDAFISVQKMGTNHALSTGKPTLNFQPTTISFGIKILK